MRWRPKWVYNSNVEFLHSLPQMWWKQREGVALGDEDESAAGVKFSYVIRYDKGVAVVVRIDESEYADFMVMIEWILRNKGTPIEFWFDQDDETTKYLVIVESPKAGQSVEPVRDGQAHWVFTLPMTLRSSTGERINVATLPAVAEALVAPFIDDFTGDGQLVDRVSTPSGHVWGAQDEFNGGGALVGQVGEGILKVEADGGLIESPNWVSGSNDQRICGNFVIPAGGVGNSSGYGFWLRVDDIVTPTQGYMVVLTPNNEGDDVVVNIVPMDDAEEPDLVEAITTVSIERGSGHSFEFRAVGGHLSVILDGVEILTADITGSLTGRRIGIDWVRNEDCTDFYLEYIQADNPPFSEF